MNISKEEIRVVKILWFLLLMAIFFGSISYSVGCFFGKQEAEEIIRSYQENE